MVVSRLPDREADDDSCLRNRAAPATCTTHRAVNPMSIKIFNGYRVKTTDPDAFLTDAETVLAPVRDFLDARLYAKIVADLIDGRDLRGRDIPEPVKATAWTRFLEEVNDGEPGYVWNHPHSLDIDYGYPPENDEHLFVLLHAQCEEYRDRFESLPGVEEFPYWNNTDGPDDLTDEEWDERGAAWEWLTNAHRISDVMSRWTYRPDPTPDYEHVLDSTVILAHLPSVDARARAIARDLVCSEHFAGETNLFDRIGEVMEVLESPEVSERAQRVAPTLRTITAADLNGEQS